MRLTKQEFARIEASAGRLPEVNQIVTDFKLVVVDHREALNRLEKIKTAIDNSTTNEAQLVLWIEVILAGET